MEATEVAEVEEVEEEVVGKSSFATTPEITGTGGKTVEDFVDTYKYTKGTGKTYATMVPKGVVVRPRGRGADPRDDRRGRQGDGAQHAARARDARIHDEEGGNRGNDGSSI